MDLAADVLSSPDGAGWRLMRNINALVAGALASSLTPPQRFQGPLRDRRLDTSQGALGIQGDSDTEF